MSTPPKKSRSVKAAPVPTVESLTAELAKANADLAKASETNKRYQIMIVRLQEQRNDQADEAIKAYVEAVLQPQRRLQA